MPATCRSASACSELELDVAVELGEALLAGQLGTGGSEEPGQEAVAIWVGHDVWASVCSAGAELAIGERGSELAAGVVDGLVERSAGGVEALGEDVDRDVVECDGEEDLALVAAEVAFDRAPQGGELLSRLDVLVGRRPIFGDQRPGLGLERHFAPLPGAAADLDPGLEQGEFVRPGGEAAVAAEVVELAQDGDEGVVGALVREVVVVVAAQVRERRTAAVDLEACRLQKQGVQVIDPRVALATSRAEPVDPRL